MFNAKSLFFRKLKGENYYYEKFQKTKSVEDEIKYNEICWISDTTVLDVAITMQKELNIDLNNYRKSRKK